jgi:exopolysaccharide production protein ExoZ
VLFLKKRAVRVLPMYWLAFGCFLAGILIFPSLVQGRVLSWQNIVSDLLLLPRSGEMILGVAWTLRHELVFYLIFALGIFIPKAGLKPVMIWQMAVLINLFSPVPGENPWVLVFLNVYNLGFGAGILMARQLERPATSPVLVMILGSTAFLTSMAVEWSQGAFPNSIPVIGAGLSTVVYAISASLIILSLAQIEVRFKFRDMPVLELLGGASYALYLFHGLVSSSFIRILHLMAPNLFGWFVMMIAIIFTALCVIAIHVFVEVPLLRALAPRKAPTGLLQPT